MSKDFNLSEDSETFNFLEGSGDMAVLMRSMDWSGTPLGPIAGWPQSLRTTISLCLASNFPIDIIWGSEHTQIYNDGYRIVCGDKHPAALGSNFTECWATAWPVIGKSFEQAIAGTASFLENQRMFLFRNGYLEETFFTFSLSPIRDESGGIAGLFHPVTETTAMMIVERQTRVLRDLTAHLGAARSRTDVFRLTSSTLSAFDLDVPFVLLYALDEDGQTYRLAGSAGLDGHCGINPQTLSVADDGVWPMERLLNQDAIEVSGIRSRFEDVLCGPYEEAPDAAFARAIRQPGVALPVALFMAGASPRLPMTDAYRGFYDLLAAACGAALARVIAYEEEHTRMEKLAAIDRAKTIFFSNVSHEFRTPLTLMLGPLEDALQSEGLPPEQKGRLAIANRNALRLLKLVNSLLDFSRIEAGRTNASFMPTDLASFTAELASSFRAACMRAGLQLTVNCAPLRMPVWIDRDMWEKIVLNLLSNAFKFTLQGSIAVSLRERNDMAVLTVSDTGVGIPHAELDRIFDRFHRIEGQHGRSVEGTGIGLALSKELVQALGGTINVESVQGQGTQFEVQVPFGTAHLAPELLRSAPGAPPKPDRARVFLDEVSRWLPDDDTSPPMQKETTLRSTDAARPRIVFADDNADMRSYVQRLLEEGGYEVELASNGRAALEAIKSGKLPDLVLSDVMMPDMDGFALLQALRADPATKGVVVILLSARAGEEARVEGLAAGADDYLVKPFGARELRARIDGAISLDRLRLRLAAASREQALLHQLEVERGRAALRESEAHVASLFEQTKAGIAEANLAGRLIRVNDRFCSIVARSRAELIGCHINTLIHPDDLADNAMCLKKLMKTGESYETDGRFQRPDGTAVWVSQTVSSISNTASGAADSMMAVVLDITERKRAEAALRQTSLGLASANTALHASESRLRAIMESAMDAIITADDNQVIVLFNAAACTMFSCTVDDAVGRPMTDFIPLRLHASYLSFVNQIGASPTTGAGGSLEVALRRNGDEFPVEASYSNVTESGTMFHTLILRDVTERVQAYTALERSNLDLQQFAFAASHDLKTPLRSIGGYVQVLQRRYARKLDDEGLSLIRRTSEATSRLEQLTDNLLAYARISAEVKPLQWVDCGESAVEAVQLLHIDIESRGVEVIFEEMPRVWADQNQLIQLFMNLIGNGIKYCKAESPRVRVSARRGTLEWIISVQDNGIGIDAANHTKIFDVFTRLHSRVEYEGTGIGLGICRRVVERHGGKIWVESSPGQGSTFSFTIPDGTNKAEETKT